MDRYKLLLKINFCILLMKINLYLSEKIFIIKNQIEKQITEDELYLINHQVDTLYKKILNKHNKKGDKKQNERKTM